MKVSEQDLKWRAALHAQLDALLNFRAELETEAGVGDEADNAFIGSRSYAYLATTPIGPKAKAFLKKSMHFVAEATGKRLRCAAFQMPANDGPQQRLVLRHWLNTVEPLLDLPHPTLATSGGNDCLAESTVWLALRALDVGEVWDIFQPGPRGNRPANSYSLSVARLSALEWKRRLISLGQSEGEANRHITSAFGEQWDTIRKWEPSCKATLGEGYVIASLKRAETIEKALPPLSGLNALLGEDWTTRLTRSGNNYRAEKRRAAELSPAKRAAARRAEKQAT